MANMQSYPPPPVLDFTSRRLPQHRSPRSDYQRSPLSSQLVQAAPLLPRSQPPSYQAAPPDKLLSPHPHMPPSSDSRYSPRNSPSRRNVEVMLPPWKLCERYDACSHHQEQSYAVPVELHR